MTNSLLNYTGATTRRLTMKTLMKSTTLRIEHQDTHHNQMKMVVLPANLTQAIVRQTKMKGEFLFLVGYISEAWVLYTGGAANVLMNSCMMIDAIIQ